MVEKEATGAADAYSVNHDTTLTVPADTGVLSNDYSSTGGTLTASLNSGPANGSLTLNANGSFTYTPSTHFVGTDSFTYQVSDGTGSPSSATATITVVNTAPYAFDHIYNVVHDRTLTVNAPGALDGDTDAENDSLTAALVSNPSHGSVTLTTNGSFTYVPNAHFLGTDSFTYKANDGLADSNVATATINVTDNAPTPQAQAYSTLHDHALTMGNVLTGTSDPDSDPLTAAVVTPPTNGTLSLNSNGTFTYTPNAHWVGTDSFTYKANDGVLDSPAAPVVITVTNHAPVAIGYALSGTHDQTLNSVSSLAGTGQDADGDPLTVGVVSPTSHGTLTVNPSGTFSYVPNHSFYGTDSFTYQLNDGTSADNLSNVATVTLTIVEQRPFAVGAAVNGYQNQTLGGTASLAMMSLDGDHDPLTASLVSGPSHGTLQFFASGMFSYNPGSYVGSDSFTYQVTDGVLTSNVATVVLNVLPSQQMMMPPPPPPTNPLVGGTASTVTHDHTLTGNTLVVMSNPTNQPVTASLVAGPTHGTMTLNADGSFTYVPNAGYSGMDSFSYQGSNGGGTSNVALCVISVVEQAPVAKGQAYSVTHDHTLSTAAPGVRSAASDADGDNLTLALVSGTTSGSLTLNADGSFTYVPNAHFIGTDSFTYKVNDGLLDSNVATVAITVTDHEPLALGDAYNLNQYDTLTVAAPGVGGNDSDADGDALAAVLDSAPSSGTLTFNADGSFSYVPTLGFTGIASFTYHQTDQMLASLTTTAFVFVPPVFYTGSTTVYNGLAGASGGQVVTNPNKLTRGAVTVANLNDTNGNGTVDNADANGAAAGTAGRNEIDLMQLVLTQPQLWGGIPANAGLVRVRVAGGNARLWTTSNKGPAAPATLNMAAFAGGNVTWWVEAPAGSGALRDIDLVYEYQPAAGANWLKLDEVKATAVWVTQTRSWTARTATPVPGDAQLPDLTQPSIQKFITEDLAADGTRYGHGPLGAIAGVDQWFGGRILIEFTVAPLNVQNLGVVFDITRQIQSHDWTIANGGGALVGANTNTFPWLRNPTADNELPTDDTSDSDEQNVPVNGHLYVYDSPARRRINRAEAFAISQSTFKEWVRVRLDGQPFLNQQRNPNFAATAPAARQQVEGSRSSDKFDWHVVYYTVRDANGNLNADTASPSANAPVLNSPGGANGTAVVTPGTATDPVEGWTATYAIAGAGQNQTFTWTLQGTSAAGDKTTAVVNGAPPAAGTKWVLNIGNKVSVTITQGATAFGNGDTFTFSVFRSVNPNGKLRTRASITWSILTGGVSAV